MVLKGVNWVYNCKIRSNSLEMSQLCIHNANISDKLGQIRWHGLERSQLGTQYKNQVIWSWMESTGYILIKLGQMS